MSSFALACIALAFASGPSAHAYEVPSIPLQNSAVPGLSYPVTGLGTGGYGHNATNPMAWPECWSDSAGCGASVLNATIAYLRLAASLSSTQVRLDNANSYDDVDNVGLAMQRSGLPRSSIFLLSKTGSGYAMGYADTQAQMAAILSAGGYSYVDALLIHWPTSTAASQEPACQTAAPTYNATHCRLETWRAYVDIFKAGQARSIGVSNYDRGQLQEIVDAGMPLPAINQIPYHSYRSSTWADTVAWCNRHGVLVNAYSPYGVPDYHTFPPPMARTPMEDPVVTAIAQAHQRTPAAVLSAWLYAQGIALNPRTYNASHMQDNLLAFDL